MRFRVNDTDEKYHIYSIARTEEVKRNLISCNLSYWYIDEKITQASDGKILFPKDACEKLNTLSNYDVVEVYPNGTASLFYEDATGECVFCVSDKCNSNCVMCPTGEETRRKGDIYSVERLISLARHIPEDVEHITITGGEPFMMRKKIFPFLLFLRTRFFNTEFLLLTNGRALSMTEYCTELLKTAPENIFFGIPLHASNKRLHDFITQADGSFEQTIAGIHNLLAMRMKVELRIVVSNLNADDMFSLSKMIAGSFPSVDHVCIMAMEMTGNAYKNKSYVWLPYKQAFQSIEKAIDLLLNNGINVRLYNFPLCTVMPAYWTLCRKSITPYKIRYLEKCNVCRMKDACGGLFGSSFKLEEPELDPIL